MSISLYAHGPAKIEVGRYNLSLEEACEDFLQLCKKHNIKVEKKLIDNGVKFIAKNDLDKGLYKLLSEVADVMDLHGDPPNVYSLIEEKTLKERYYTTGSYND